MAKFRTSVNLADAARTMENQKGEFFVVLETFDFGRDVNGNTINKYRAFLTRGDLASVQNNYTAKILVLESPRRREQSTRPGKDMAEFWLEKIGYDLAYESMTTLPFSKKEGWRIVYRVENKYLKNSK